MSKETSPFALLSTEFPDRDEWKAALEEAKRGLEAARTAQEAVNAMEAMGMHALGLYNHLNRYAGAVAENLGVKSVAPSMMSAGLTLQNVATACLYAPPASQVRRGFRRRDGTESDATIFVPLTPIIAEATEVAEQIKGDTGVEVSPFTVYSTSFANGGAKMLGAFVFGLRVHKDNLGEMDGSQALEFVATLLGATKGDQAAARKASEFMTLTLHAVAFDDSGAKHEVLREFRGVTEGNVLQLEEIEDSDERRALEEGEAAGPLAGMANPFAEDAPKLPVGLDLSVDEDAPGGLAERGALESGVERDVDGLPHRFGGKRGGIKA